MFKRVTKKQKKREELEELGLSDIANDDSSDSGSSSSSEDPSDAEEDIGSEDEGQDAAAVEEDDDGVQEDADEEEDDSDEDDDPPLTIEEAKRNPIYLVSEEPSVHECIVCPGKKLKKENTISEHIQSSSHKRRFERFLETIKDTTFGTNDPRLIVEAISTLSKNSPNVAKDTSAMSNREKKRKDKMDQIKKMRKTQKEMKAKAKARKEKKTEAEARKETTKPAVVDNQATTIDDKVAKPVKDKSDKSVADKRKASKGKEKENEKEGPSKKRRKVTEDASHVSASTEHVKSKPVKRKRPNKSKISD